MLYFAYGSNLNIGQMRTRCPNATPVAALELQNWKLVFRGVADIVRAEGSSVQGGIWRITEDCERRLDRYEGFRPDDAGMYSKEYVLVDGLPDGEHAVMVYTMNSDGIYPPSSGYFAGIKEGYENFGLPIRPLIEALELSYDDKKPSYVERQRMRRTGRPRLAARPSVVQQENKRPEQHRAERKAKRKLSKAERKAIHRANAKQFHDPWADTSWAKTMKRQRQADANRRGPKSLDEYFQQKYYGGERY